MKRIGVLTFHKSINYGAFMQCYSFVTRLQKDFHECKVEVIDYVPEHTLNSHCSTIKKYLLGSNRDRLSLKTIAIRLALLIKDPKALKRKKVLVEAFKSDWEKLPLSSEKYYNYDCGAFFSAIKEKYDAVIVGSDGVWEFISYPFPNPYYLGWEKGPAKFSYAASSDRMYFPNLSPENKTYIQNSLKTYSFIGIRDIATENFISAITDKTLIHTCDPTIFLSLSELPVNLERVKKLLLKNGIDLKKPIIGVMGDDNIGKLLRSMFGCKYQIVAVYAYTKYADVFLDDLTPLEWSLIFSLFSITFTRFFHGTILSLKNGTPTITIDPWKMEDARHITKIKDLYMRLNLESHYFKKELHYSADEIKEIKDATEYFINNPDKAEIKIALDNEMLSYNNFKDELCKWLNTN